MCVLSACTVVEDGWPVLLHVNAGLARIGRCRLTIPQHLVTRRLRDPLRVIRDGAPRRMGEPIAAWKPAARAIPRTKRVFVISAETSHGGCIPRL